MTGEKTGRMMILKGENQPMKQAILKIINPVLAVLMLNQILTAALHGVIHRKAYAFFHEGGGILLAGLSVLHVLLNWKWVQANFFKKPS
ncbi:MAG: hypothetical protein C4518_16085 [Desulfobacteraceae bacterium]|nr:MAG: hypothetical protein C4518_16085 [Desulfobacteraceae bacterium]